ncbi:hypothetical protein [Psychrobacter sp. AOP31-A1-22]|uniref:hypothetical protein n=1 Tax=Psychrobacter sp. AOP31-A1-22 TaxID=3457696 RepID=UPI004036DCAD
MLNKREYHTVLMQGTLVGDVVVNEDGEIPSASFMLLTADRLLDETISQIHNFAVIGEQLVAIIKTCEPGQRIRASGKIVWHDSDYASTYIEGERNADLIASDITLIPYDGTRFTSYQSIMLAGEVVEDADFSASMYGSNTRFCLNTSDTFLGESLLQFHSFVALNKIALTCKDIKEGQFVRVIGQLLWLDGKSNAIEFDDERGCEIVALQVSALPAPAEPPIKPASEVNNNISDLLQLIEQKGDVNVAVQEKDTQYQRQRLLSKILGTQRQ